MATSGHSGYPLKWFKDQNAARNAFECAICLEILKDPVQIRDCGHQFCSLCVEDILKADPRCPSCRITISNAMMFDDHAARRLIKNLDVNCCNEGCGWCGTLGAFLQDHMNRCKHAIHSCSVSQELQQKLETVVTEIGRMKKKFDGDFKQFASKYENQVKQLKLQHKSQIKEIKSKHEQDIKQLELKFENRIKLANSKHEEDMMILRQELVLLQAMGPVRAQSSNPQDPKPTLRMPLIGVTVKLAEAKSSNKFGVIESLPFSCSSGYQMKVLVYLNQGPSGYSGYMGVYLALLKGDGDSFLPWPFTKSCTFVLVDQQDDDKQRKNIEYTMIPTGQEQFKRPTRRENEGLGNQRFVSHSTLRSRQYIKDNTAYINVFIGP